MQLSFELAAMELPRARVRDPVTSHGSATRARELAKQHHVLILGALARGPMGVDAIGEAVRLNGYQIGKRMCELQRVGAVELTGLEVMSNSGRLQREWRRKA
jgi:predicted ArsR family transcriptional regulator